jgi:hypothetical protein
VRVREGAGEPREAEATARMTPKEAAAVNTLFGFLTGIDREIPSAVAQAMEVLASRAHNRLQAGVDENAVRAQWPAAFPTT